MIDSRTVVVCNINDVYITMPLKMAQANLLDRVTHHFASNGKIKIHYVTLGEGPLVLFLHGFPEYWYTWRCQMEALASEFTVAAMDLRGFNRSDSPKGVEEYAMSHLLEDVATVIKDCGQELAIVVGHDWGGVIAWQFGVQRPDMTRKLVVLNVPHPNGFARELANNPRQQENSAYARAFQEKDASDPDVFFGEPMTSASLAAWVADDNARAHFVKAFERSDFQAMLNYYKANYPRELDEQPTLPNLQMPVLMFYGLADEVLLSDGLNNTWDWLSKDLTLVTLPGVGHFVQEDAAERVSMTLKWWLNNP